MKLIQELHEMSRNDQLKANFAKALASAAEKYKEEFGDKLDDVRSALLGKFDPNLTKGEMTQTLTDAGVSNASTIAQYLINQSHKNDTEASRLK